MEVWIITFSCVSVLSIYGLVVVNIGSLYRMRYVFLMLLVALGLAGFVELYAGKNWPGAGWLRKRC